MAFKIRGPVRKNTFPKYPVHLLLEGKLPGRPPGLGQIPTFLLKQGSKTKYVFVNGFSEETTGNGIVD